MSTYRCRAGDSAPLHTLSRGLPEHRPGALLDLALSPFFGGEVDTHGDHGRPRGEARTRRSRIKSNLKTAYYTPEYSDHRWYNPAMVGLQSSRSLIVAGAIAGLWAGCGDDSVSLTSDNIGRNAASMSATDPSASAGTDESAGGSDSAAASGDSQGADCNPAGCSDYCELARCLFPGDLDGAMCRAKCNEVCGNLFFDGEDQSVMDCLAAVESPSASCSDAEACCDEFFTNEICP